MAGLPVLGQAVPKLAAAFMSSGQVGAGVLAATIPNGTFVDILKFFLFL